MGRYARKLTRQELIDGGIFITPDNRIFKNDVDITDNMPLNPDGYKILFIYDRDENGNCIKQYYTNKKGQYTYTYKQRTITLNRALLAWYNGEVADGFVSDHVDNQRDNYDPDNLQPLTPGQNIGKERDNWNVKELKCNMRKPREFYEKKLDKYLAEYTTAKYINNAEKAHFLRCNISQTRARLRYWDAHKDEWEAYMIELEEARAEKARWRDSVRDRKELTYWKNLFKEQGDKEGWHQMCCIIKNWDKYNDLTKNSIFATLHGNLGNFGQFVNLV